MPWYRGASPEPHRAVASACSWVIPIILIEAPVDGQSGIFRNELLAALPLAEQQRLLPFTEEIAMPLRQTLCETGAPITHAVFPCDAITSTLVQMPEGDSIEVGLMGAEGVVGLDLLYGVRESATTVVVQLAGSGVRIRTDDFEREVLAKNGDFYSLLLRYSRAFFAMVAQSGACNASHALQQRLARWLLLVHDRVRTDRFPLTHEYIALMLGVRRATVSEAANGLRIAGAIDYDRGEIRVMERHALERSACGCYAVMRRLADGVFAR